jgi:hypothetical protein
MIQMRLSRRLDDWSFLSLEIVSDFVLRALNFRAAAYPCRCLCRALVQTTNTRPLRRTILQFSQIRLTLVRTFIFATRFG